MIRVKWDSTAYRPQSGSGAPTATSSDGSDIQEIAVQPSRALPPRSGRPARPPAPLPPAGMMPAVNHTLSPVVDILGGSLGSTPNSAGSSQPHRRTPHKKWCVGRGRVR